MQSIIKIESFYGDDLLKRETECKPLIEGYLWEGDVIMLLGSEKAGKSILALQMAAALSSGSMFLGKYKCEKTVVAYIQTEGKKDETAIRLENMMKGLDLDPYYFQRYYKKFLPFNIPVYMKALQREIDAMPVTPRVLFLDCLYMSMVGDLNGNKEVRDFIAALSMLLEKYKMTCVLVHHAKRDEFFEGNTIAKGDKVSYGSVFLRANVDHILYLEMLHDKTRNLTCDTQRSGRVVEKEKLVLLHPAPLLFKIMDKLSGAEETIFFHLKKNDYSKTDLSIVTGYSDSTIDRAVKVLLESNQINILREIKSERGFPTKIYGIQNAQYVDQHLNG